MIITLIILLLLFLRALLFAATGQIVSFVSDSADICTYISPKHSFHQIEQ